MRRSLFLISLALSSAACSQSPAENTADEPALVATADAAADAGAPAADTAKAVDFEDDDTEGEAVREFAYKWPSAVSATPALAKRLTAEREKALAEQKAEWAEALQTSPEGCISCVNRGYEVEWKVVADIPGWLSLSQDFYVFTGGAHGNYGRRSMVWNRETGEGMDGIALFKSPVTLENALGRKLCDALDRQRERKRGMKVDRAAGGIFDDCPGLDEASVFVGSSDGEHFDRIGIYFGPYVAGSYAEGAYELNFPVTASVLDAVKPEFAEAFRVAR